MVMSESKEQSLATKQLFFNARVHTLADGLVVDSIAINKSGIVAVGRNLQYDPDFSSYEKYDLGGLCITPGFVDAHTHFYFMALARGRVRLQGLTSVEACLEEIGRFARGLSENDWVVGEGFELDRFRRRVELNRFMLDTVTGGRPALIMSKDQHTVWVNSRALELAGINSHTRQPDGGTIGFDVDGEPNGLLYEGPASQPVFALLKPPAPEKVDRLYRHALKSAYQVGVTGVHSFDSPQAFEYFLEKAEKGKLGLRINYYPQADMLDQLRRDGVGFGQGDEFLRIAGVKIFADGSLGSRTALCFNRYPGTDNYGIEVTSVAKLKKLARAAARLGLPCAVHAIGDKAVSNVLDALATAPKLKMNARHRIEHLQLVRRKDIARLKKLGVVGSMQPSHCPSDIDLIDRYWSKRGRNAFIFRTLLDKKIPLAFGSDAPIAPLNPLEGMAAAVRRARENQRRVFFPEQRITAAEALYGFTAGPAYAVGQEYCRGYLLPGYPADLVVLSEDITKVSALKISQIEVLATMLDGKLVHYRDELRF